MRKSLMNFLLIWAGYCEVISPMSLLFERNIGDFWEECPVFLVSTPLCLYGKAGAFDLIFQVIIDGCYHPYFLDMGGICIAVADAELTL